MNLPMTASRRGPAPADWVPVETCSLPTVEQPLRVAEFDALFRAALRSVEHPADAATRARLVLAGGAELPGHVQRLADAETACCSFFTFTLTLLPADPDVTRVALDVEVPPARADVLAALVHRAEATRVAPS